MNGGVKPPTSGARVGIEPHRPDVAGARGKTGGKLVGIRQFDHHDRNPDVRAKLAHDLDPDTLDLAGCGILHVLRRKQRNPHLAGADEVGDPRVGALLRVRHGANAVKQRSHFADV